jgi:sigma-B regulation protein RsbU (phosphoserine phosphatase)
VVADVSGHGFGPALIAVETRAVLRQMLHVETDPSTVLTRLNCILCDDTDDEVFVTMFLLVLDPQKGSLEYAAAGHEGFRISPQGMVERLPANGLPLGLEPGAVYRARPQRPLQEGETIVVVTDGLIEARSSAGDLYGTPRLVRALPEWCRSSANEMLERLVSKVQAFAPGAPLDDATLLVLKRCADAVGPADAVREEHSSRFEAEKLALKVGAT